MAITADGLEGILMEDYRGDGESDSYGGAPVGR